MPAIAREPREAAEPLPPKVRRLLKGLFLLAGAGSAVAACSVPLLFPSTSLWYKLGWDKTLLQAGKACGLLAGWAVLVQLVLAARLSILDRVFSLNGLLAMHRCLGISAVALAVLHPLLVFAPEDVRALQIEAASWPEGLGAALLLVLWLSAGLALRRESIGLPYAIWKQGHRAAGVLLAGLLAVHVLFVSDSFEAGPPRAGLFTALGLFAAVWLWARSRPWRLRRRSYAVACVEPTGTTAYALRLERQGGAPLAHASGQFAFLCFPGSALPREEHPFTIASAPEEADRPQVIIRCSGDWTSRIGRLKPGDAVRIDGPYGLFSQMAWPKARELLLVAGGVGVTPMLSMLRRMAWQSDPRRATLIWSNRTREDLVCPQAFRELEEALPNLRIIRVLTREEAPGFEPGPLTRERLQSWLPEGQLHRVLAFLCGPPPMMDAVRRDLRALGLPRRFIRREAFRF